MKRSEREARKLLREIARREKAEGRPLSLAERTALVRHGNGFTQVSTDSAKKVSTGNRQGKQNLALGVLRQAEKVARRGGAAALRASRRYRSP